MSFRVREIREFGRYSLGMFEGWGELPDLIGNIIPTHREDCMCDPFGGVNHEVSSGRQHLGLSGAIEPMPTGRRWSVILLHARPVSDCLPWSSVS